MNQGRFQVVLFRLATLLLCMGLAGCTAPMGGSARPAPTPLALSLGLHAVGTRIVISDGKGKLTPMVYHGVNRSGAEYVCSQAAQGKGKTGTFDGQLFRGLVASGGAPV